MIRDISGSLIGRVIKNGWSSEGVAMRGRTEIPKGIDQTERGGQIGHFVKPAQAGDLCRPQARKGLLPAGRRSNLGPTCP